ncbi:MAG: hypothetical protein RLZ28_877 [Actinomycetota bacterium]
MKRIFAAIAVGLSVCSLTACSIFYPNWGATDLPTTTPSSSASESQTPSPTATPEPSETATASPSSTTRIEAEVQVLDATADATAQTLTVIAQVTNFSETGGKCILSVKAAGVTKTFAAVNAEANATSTQCFPIMVPIAGLASGSAAVQVTYDSATASGRSPFFAVTIP